jgi:hypothetical protein
MRFLERDGYEVLAVSNGPDVFAAVGTGFDTRAWRCRTEFGPGHARGGFLPGEVDRELASHSFEES